MQSAQFLYKHGSFPNGIVRLWGAQHCSVSRRWWRREHTVSSPCTKGYPERPR